MFGQYEWSVVSCSPSLRPGVGLENKRHRGYSLFQLQGGDCETCSTPTSKGFKKYFYQLRLQLCLSLVTSTCITSICTTITCSTFTSRSTCNTCAGGKAGAQLLAQLQLRAIAYAVAVIERYHKCDILSSHNCNCISHQANNCECNCK